jgi:hypothetical protein
MWNAIIGIVCVDVIAMWLWCLWVSCVSLVGYSWPFECRRIGGERLWYGVRRLRRDD